LNAIRDGEQRRTLIGVGLLRNRRLATRAVAHAVGSPMARSSQIERLELDGTIDVATARTLPRFGELKERRYVG
jgi:hypothetical protein